MADVASLGLAISSDSVKQADVALQAFTQTASASERAAKKWGIAADGAGASAESFSKRVRNTIASLEFERQQVSRSAAEREKFNALRRAGVSAASQEGQAIAASIGALQAQRAATATVSERTSALIGWVRGLAAAYGAAYIARKLFESAKAAADLGEEADQIGITVEGLQALRYQAVQNNLSAEELDTTIAKFTRTLGEAGNGNKDAIESFDRLGVKILDASGNMRPVQDNLVDLARKITAIEDPTKRAAAAVDFFGKGGQRALPLLQQIAQGFDELQRVSAKGIVSKEDVDVLDKAFDRLAARTQEGQANFAKFAAGLVRGFNDLDDAYVTYVKRTEAARSKQDEIWDLRDVFNSAVAQVAGFVAGIATAFSQIATTIKMAFVNGMNDAIAAVESGLNAITGALADSWLGKQLGVGGTVNLGRIAGGGPLSSAADINAAVSAAQAAAIAANTPAGPTFAEQRKSVLAAQARAAASGGGVPTGPTTTGVGMPAIKSTGGGSTSDPYAKLITSAQQYIATKNTETAAIGLNAQAAERLKHEQELLGKAANDNLKLGPQQVQQLKDLATTMAEADAKFKTAKFLDDANTKAMEFIASQQLERDALFLSTEAADALRRSQEGLNEARRLGIDQMPGVIDAINRNATAMAAAAEQTRQFKEVVDLAKDVTGGFFTDLLQALEQGQNLWQAFGTAATSALNKIADKLLQMAVDQLWEKALGPAAQGFLSSILGGGQFATVIGTQQFGPPAPIGSRLGNVFYGGNVIPFARGGIVNHPTLFPMAGGAGLMGEAGPEGVLPLRRASNGELGVRASGGGSNVIVNVVTPPGMTAERKDSRSADGGQRVDIKIVEMVEAGIAGNMARGTGPLNAVTTSRYGLGAARR